MDDMLDAELLDRELGDEIRLVTELMVVASMAKEEELEQGVIDYALGVQPRRFPRQRVVGLD